MIHISKYKFTSKEQFDAKLESLVDVKFDKAELGHIVLASAVVDEEGVEVTPEVISEGWHVDMIWHDIEDHPYGWKSYNVDLSSEGSHGFAGVSYLANKF